MNIYEMKFEEELKALRKEYTEQFKRHGHLGDTVMKIKLRFICKRYGKNVEDYWKGN